MYVREVGPVAVLEEPALVVGEAELALDLGKLVLDVVHHVALRQT